MTDPPLPLDGASGTHGSGPTHATTHPTIKTEPGSSPEPNAAAKRFRNDDEPTIPLCTYIQTQAPSASAPEERHQPQPAKKLRSSTYTARCCTCNTKTAKCKHPGYCNCFKAGRKCSNCACANCDNSGVPIHHRTALTSTPDDDTKPTHDDGFIALGNGVGAPSAGNGDQRRAQPTRDAPTPGAAAAAAPTDAANMAAGANDNETSTSSETVDEDGDLPGYIATDMDLWLDTLYGGHLCQNPGEHLSGGIADDKVWQTRMGKLMPYHSRLYSLPRGKPATRFLTTLAALFDGVVGRKWNSEQPMVYIMTILQRNSG